MIKTSYFLYFTSVFLVFLYGFEFSFIYMKTFIVVNTYYTFGEYIFHRFTFHSELFYNISRGHLKHHKDPHNDRAFFIPIPITLFNDILIFGIMMICNDSLDKIIRVISCAHLSYLLFELSHYGTHYRLPYLPKRLLGFHEYHHHESRCNFGFTTPSWDILFGTCNPLALDIYPLSFLPISIISFLSVNDLQIITNGVYIYPAIMSYQNGWNYFSIFYTSVGCISAFYHYLQINYPHSRFYNKISHIDRIFAVSYFFISLYIFVFETKRYWSTVCWCVFSLVLFKLDFTIKNSGFLHVLWHISTGIGVGEMIRYI